MSQFYILDSFESRKEVERPFGHNTHGLKIGGVPFWRQPSIVQTTHSCFDWLSYRHPNHTHTRVPASQPI